MPDFSLVKQTSILLKSSYFIGLYLAKTNLILLCTNHTCKYEWIIEKQVGFLPYWCMIIQRQNNGFLFLRLIALILNTKVFYFLLEIRTVVSNIDKKVSPLIFLYDAEQCDRWEYCCIVLFQWKNDKTRWTKFYQCNEEKFLLTIPILHGDRWWREFVLEEKHNDQNKEISFLVLR